MVLELTSAIPTLVAVDGVTENSVTPTSIITYGRFLEYIENGWVKKVDFYNNSKFAVIEAATPESGYRSQKIGVNVPSKDIKLIRKLKDSNINFDVHAVEASAKAFELFSINFFTISIFFGLILGLYFLVNRVSDGSGSNSGNPFNPFGFRQFFQARAKYDSVPVTGITFDDIAGIDEVKEEFQEIVTFLKKPERYTRVGAKIPKGVLLSGPPGTGKTLLAKAIAGEAKVPFFSCSASEFVELFVGIGASRIRDLFRRAKAKTPCIIFIDEIDAVGRQRGAGVGGGNDEREQTLNQLLTEMDGFETNNGVIVIAATNRVDILDSALLRPGRFDRQLAVSFPDAKARLSIIKVHSRDKKLDDDVQLQTIAKRTPGFSGADLANVMNEAAILTARNNEKAISMKRLNEALDKVTGGIPRPPMEENRYKRILAYHEIGHALTASLLEYHDPVEVVSLIPRGRTRSSTTFLPTEETMYSRNQLLTRLVSLMAGRAAEEIVFGKAEVTTIAVDDIQRATFLARQIVTEYGMSAIGPIALTSQQPRDLMMRMQAQGQSYSQELTAAIDTMVRLHVEHAYNEALTIIQENRALLDTLVNRIIQKETLEGFEIRSLLSEAKPIRLILPSSKLKQNSIVIELIRQEMEKLLNTSIYIQQIRSIKSQEDEEKLLEIVMDEATRNVEKGDKINSAINLSLLGS
uniref:ATP-dependent zinc metalloprotease FtsH n=1 Tax=Pseudellipsoidion edaphicum TaxID=1431838 RepID=A0A3R5V2E4_9STRA|nr:cell division protein FTSH [Pseudellipsoidion edaphicum]QAA11928.1 cell division protein FTSH [Pseudellipsoidion edaphicum]